MHFVKFRVDTLVADCENENSEQEARPVRLLKWTTVASSIRLGTLAYFVL